MARHQADLVRCARLPGVTAGRVCAAHDGRCVAYDSMVRPAALARVCDGCGQRGGGERCVVCRAGGVADACYCKGCVQMEKDRDGCPAVVNLGEARTDAFYERNTAGRVCAAHDGRCVACDSMVRPAALARVCDGCGQRGGGERCVVCRAGGVADACYCKGCVQMEKDRDGCPAVVNLGEARTDAFYERNKYGLIK